MRGGDDAAREGGGGVGAALPAVPWLVPAGDLPDAAVKLCVPGAALRGVAGPVVPHHQHRRPVRRGDLGLQGVGRHLERSSLVDAGDAGRHLADQAGRGPQRQVQQVAGEGRGDVVATVVVDPGRPEVQAGDGADQVRDKRRQVVVRHTVTKYTAVTKLKVQ